MLDDRELGCTQNAAFALARIGTDAAIDPLIARVTDKSGDPKRRSAVLYGLCETKNPKAIDTLGAALSDHDLRSEDLRVCAALKALTGQDFGYNTSAWQKWYEKRRGTK
jgi:HEAT repeat protein